MILIIVTRSSCGQVCIWTGIRGRYSSNFWDCWTTFRVIKEILDSKDRDLWWTWRSLHVRVVAWATIKQVHLAGLLFVLHSRCGNHFHMLIFLMWHGSILLVSCCQASILHRAKVVSSTLLWTIFLCLIWKLVNEVKQLTVLRSVLS